MKVLNKLIYLSMENYINKLNFIFTKNNICESHGINHALAVLNNSVIALKYNKLNITNNEKKAIKLASLLHDADDRKFFPLNKNYENLRYILINENENLINLIIKMIDLVSSSKNNDIITDDIRGNEWMLIPRYSDRIEALGMTGIIRCHQYTITTNCKLFIETTPKPKNKKEIWNYATIERYNNYKGLSNSMMDYYFDKLLRTSLFSFDNEYLMNQAKKRRKIMLKFILYFSNLNNMSNLDVENFIKLNKN